MRAAYFSRQLPEHQRLRLSRGTLAGLWYQVRRFKPGRSRRIFRAKKSSARLPSEGKPSDPCRNLWHVKEPKTDVEVATFGKILGNFSPIGPPSATGVRSRRFKTLGTPCGGINTNYMTPIQLPTLTAYLFFCKTKTEGVISFGWKGVNTQIRTYRRAVATIQPAPSNSHLILNLLQRSAREMS
jgi:hypothetical protein